MLEDCFDEPAEMDEIPGVPRDTRLDPDEFKRGTSRRKPNHYCIAVRQAQDVHIDSMRVLLELHYDAAHQEKWLSENCKLREKNRGSKRQLFKSILDMHHNRRTERVELPMKVKEIFREPKDETDWKKLEIFRRTLLRIVQGERTVELPDAATAQILSDVLREDADATGVVLRDVVCAQDPERVVIPKGAQVDLEFLEKSTRVKKARKNSFITFIENLNRPESNRRVQVLMWPLGSDVAPPILDNLGFTLAGEQSLKSIAQNWLPTPLDMKDLLDHMLLILWRALFRAKSEEWTHRGVANLGPRRTMELGRWWLKGQAVAKKPLFDGMCAFCGCSGFVRKVTGCFGSVQIS